LQGGAVRRLMMVRPARIRFAVPDGGRRSRAFAGDDDRCRIINAPEDILRDRGALVVGTHSNHQA